MKKAAYCLMIFILLLGIAGCSGKEKSIDIDDIQGSTMLARSNGEIQVASVEDFDKDYYKLSELEDYVDQKVSSYNKKVGSDKVTVNDVEIKNGKAYLLLTYSGMDQYCAFNHETAAYFNGGIANLKIDLPTTLITSADESLASTKEVLQNKNLKILVLKEPYSIMVDGKVQYYSDNSVLLKSNTVQGAAEGMTIVVFKP